VYADDFSVDPGLCCTETERIELNKLRHCKLVRLESPLVRSGHSQLRNRFYGLGCLSCQQLLHTGEYRTRESDNAIRALGPDIFKGIAAGTSREMRVR
jgi:hypothetical protein